MGAPCINDTCSITSQVDPVTRRLQIDARLYNQGGLQCVDGEGIQLKILGDPAVASAVDTCFQQLGVDTTGYTWSIPKRARYKSFSSSANVGIPQNANEGNWTSSNPIDTNQSIVNPYACQTVAVVVGRFRIRYQIAKASDATIPSAAESLENSGGGVYYVPFNADVNCQLGFDNGASFDLTTYTGISGIMRRSDVQPTELNDEWHYFTHMQVVGANANLQLYARARHVGTGGQWNVNTVANDTGLRCDGSVFFLPFNGEVI